MNTTDLPHCKCGANAWKPHGDMAANQTELALTEKRQHALMRALESIGWQLLAAEISLVDSTARVELRRNDRLVTLDVRNGKGCLTREIVERQMVTVGPKWDRARVEQVRNRFLGRDWCSGGPPSALRMLAHYIADNANVSRMQARNALRSLLTV